jgi:hypothetical protein
MGRLPGRVLAYGSNSQISRDASASGLLWIEFPAARTGASAQRLMGYTLPGRVLAYENASSIAAITASGDSVPTESRNVPPVIPNDSCSAGDNARWLVEAG